MAENLFGDWSAQKNWLTDVGTNLNNFGKNLLVTYGQQASPYSVRPTAPKPTPQPRGLTDAQRRAMIEDKKTSYAPPAPPAPTPGFGGPSAPQEDPTAAMFNPLFDLIKKQREAADSRYAANKGEIENIFGQLTTARRSDVASTTAAYNALSSAAAARSTAVNTGIDASEAARLSGNEAVLQSMGLGDVSSARLGDVASEQAASAKNVEGINSANWQGLLAAMGANAQDVISQDVQSYGYQQGRDTQDLQRSLQNYQQGLDTQEFQTTAKAAEAKFQYNEAQKAARASAAAAAASATNAADKAASERAQELLKNADPLTRAVARGVEAGYPNFNSTKIEQAYFNWMATRGTSPTSAGVTQWNKGSATADAMKYVGDQLSEREKGALIEAIGSSF
jgi:hypothetical protein